MKSVVEKCGSKCGGDRGQGESVSGPWVERSVCGGEVRGRWGSGWVSQWLLGGVVSQVWTPLSYDSSDFMLP